MSTAGSPSPGEGEEMNRRQRIFTQVLLQESLCECGSGLQRLGGPGSGCSGPNCGRSASGGKAEVKVRYKSGGVEPSYQVHVDGKLHKSFDSHSQANKEAERINSQKEQLGGPGSGRHPEGSKKGAGVNPGVSDSIHETLGHNGFSHSKTEGEGKDKMHTYEHSNGDKVKVSGHYDPHQGMHHWTHQGKDGESKGSGWGSSALRSHLTGSNR